jgi:hypothetical protein
MCKVVLIDSRVIGILTNKHQMGRTGPPERVKSREVYAAVLCSTSVGKKHSRYYVLTYAQMVKNTQDTMY